MYDIVALGELLIDFAPAGPRTYVANAGGSPPNLLAAAARVGCKAAFIGLVGEDDFGAMLTGDLRQAGVDVSGVRTTSTASTTLAFVTLDEKGDRSFTFVRKPGADMLLRPEHVDRKLIDSGRVYHFSAVTMTDEPAAGTNFEMAAYARSRGLTVSFDPNLRPMLWSSMELAKERITKAVAYADILKISEEELLFLTGSEDLMAGTSRLLEMGPKLVLVTLGPKGCFYRTAVCHGHLPTYDTKVVDTTGCGDAFLGSFLAKLLENPAFSVDRLDKATLDAAVDFANCVGALAATKKGGIPSMPDREQVAVCMADTPRLILPL